jgi:hypothetical protein
MLAVLFLAIELAKHLVVATPALLRWIWVSGVVTEHFVNLHTASAIRGRTGRARLVRGWGSSIVVNRSVMR